MTKTKHNLPNSLSLPHITITLLLIRHCDFENILECATFL